LPTAPIRIGATGPDAPRWIACPTRRRPSPQRSADCCYRGDEGKAIEKQAFEGLKNPCRMRKFGIPSTWFEAPHTYGCKVTETDTIYYCDDIEVGRHPTFRLCREKPLFFMINLATGGGWPVDLSRYNGVADMYVDYVRVYAR
jgi:hypothetical protein